MKFVNNIQQTYELKKAIENGELKPWFQPIISAKSGHLIGCEILVRWEHPDRGLITPDKFISLAESTGLIYLLTEYLFSSVTNTLRHHNMKIPDNFHIAFNISPINFSHNGFGVEYLNLLDTITIQNMKLVLELTEHTEFSSQLKHIVFYKNLRGKHVSLALDDFGTGYSGLKMIQSMPFDFIKIDKHFVHGLKKDSISEHIIDNILDLSHRINTTVVAEGIENKSQELTMINKGVDYLQGFLYSPPIPEKNFISEWVNRKLIDHRTSLKFNEVIKL